jgi:hypothetical protein
MAPDVADANPGDVRHVPGLGTFISGPSDPEAFAVPEPRVPEGSSAPLQDVVVRANEDAFVASGQPDSNFGTESRLRIGDSAGYGATRSFVYFDLESLDPRFVVTGGTLRLFQRGGSPSGDSRDVPVRRVTGSWNERDVRWNNQPGVDDERLDTNNLGTSSGWREWDVSRAVVRWWDGRWENQGLYLQGYEADGSARDFDSREAGSRPEIELEGALDTVPPVCTMLPLAPYTNVNPFPIAWEGVDPDPASGIAFFVVWARRAGEQWAIVQPQATTTTATFQGNDGFRYEFRVHGVDKAGNQEQPAANAQAFTLLDLSPPTVNMTPLPQWVTGPSVTLQWTGQDLPVGAGLESSGIASYDIQWSINGGVWGNLALGHTATTFTAGPLTNGGNFGFRVRAVDRAQNAGEWSAPTTTTVDASPPRTWFLPTSGVDTPDFPLRWASTDHGGSGTRDYDIQFRVESGPWQDLVTATATTERTFNGEYGVNYAFRSRARDVVGNTGAYPVDPQLYVSVMHSSEFVDRLYVPHVYGSMPPGGSPRGTD